MAVFTYSAVDAAASPMTGTVVADTPRQARDALRARGLTIQSVAEDRATVPAAGARGNARQARKLVPFVRDLSTLLGVGVPVLDALDTIARQHRGPFRSCVLGLRDRVSGGASLSEAMRDQPAAFDELCVSLVEVGENAGTLDSVLDRLAAFKERSAGLRNRLGTALIYPGVVLVMAVVTSVCLMTFVVPNLLATLTDAGRPLPWPTRVVKGASDVLVHRWWLLLAVVAVGTMAGATVLRTEWGRLALHRLVLRIPVVGGLARKQAVVRVAVVMSALLKSGVVFVHALRFAADATDNLVLKDALRRCDAAVTGGQDIGQALDATGAFPPLVVQVFAVGQQSGRLEEMLDRLAADYDAQLLLASQRLTAALEPVLILLLVAMVGFIGFATVLPLMEAANAF
jgi:type II secretory pathway component PulF